MNDIYLRVVTDKVTLHSPSVREELDGDKISFGFNWIVLEDDVILISIQTFMSSVL